MADFPILHLRDYHRGGSTLAQLQSAGVERAIVCLPLALMLEHERQAIKNHDQTIARLAERGGLSATEALAVLTGRGWHEIRESEAEAHRELGEILEAWRKRRRGNDAEKQYRRALFLVAPSHQGGNGESGAAIAAALGLAFPITVDELERKAREEGFDPAELWPWLYRLRAQRAAIAKQGGADGRI